MPVPRRWRRRVLKRQALTLSRLILECIAEFGAATVSSFFPAKYPEARIWRELLGAGNGYRFRRETFSSLLSRLRAQGLIERSGSRRDGRWRLTKRGQGALARSPERLLPRPDGRQRLVIFDIPEKERVKRNALRLELAATGYVQLQKSVWLGERSLPGEFFELVDGMGLRRYVHLFSVEKSGTLPH